MKRILWICCVVCCFSGLSDLAAQQIVIEPSNAVKTVDLGDNKARVDFISASPNLSFTENGGATVQKTVQKTDGKYIYTCICNVADGNKFRFNIGTINGIATQELQVYIEDGELKEYIINVEEIPISIRNVKVNSTNLVCPDNVSDIYIKSNYNDLSIIANTGEKAKGPKQDSTGIFEYQVTFDLSTPDSREVERILTFIAGKSPYIYQIGKLQPTLGQIIAVLVITEDFYTNEKNHIRQSFLNGNYLEAYRTYQKLLAKEGEDDMPVDLNEDKKEMRRMEILAKRRIHATNLYQKGESFQGNRLDSAMYYYTEAFKQRNAILMENPSDASCLEENRIYRDFMKRADRVVSGRIIHNTQLDRNGNNVPISGVYITVTAHERVEKDVNGVKVYKVGDLVENFTQRQFQSDENGNFTVYVPRNTQTRVYLLNFKADKAAIKKKKSDSYTYLPKDTDIESNVTIKIDPLHRWWRSDEK